MIINTIMIIIIVLLAFFLGFIFGGRVMEKDIHRKLINGELFELNGDNIIPLKKPFTSFK